MIFLLKHHRSKKLFLEIRKYRIFWTKCLLWKNPYVVGIERGGTGLNGWTSWESSLSLPNEGPRSQNHRLSFCSVWASLNFRGGLNAAGVLDREAGANSFPYFRRAFVVFAARVPRNLNGRTYEQTNQVTKRRSFAARCLSQQSAKKFASDTAANCRWFDVPIFSRRFEQSLKQWV